MDTLALKYKKLLGILAETDGAVIAFSGGVDSTLLLHTAKEALDHKAIAASIATPYVPRWEQGEAKKFARQLGVKHVVVEMDFPEELRMNPPLHCYTCKKILFSKLLEVAGEHGFKHVLEGTNIDDLSDYRPGIKALRELDIRSPFVEAELSKQDIRELSRRFELPTWDKPSFACLLSRMPVDVEVTDEALQQVEQAEVFLMQIGFPAVRVRHHGEVARIEVPADRIQDFVNANEIHDINNKLKEFGYKHVTLDLGGYKMGSLNKK
ncbi:ATP-dependent sacrificial sulfur transferase LarE [Desulfovibrio sp. JC010]|uniref:ATP-dependent sacrificial sulfur transferase LarE n=1 Tax=Desulfovibrio sp. JC010 TaxID=2593641 RepID=UPI0013D84247|nr:ATP-dependent sacrificial sulfur transferase LarE [Desulfovibrio sp. JC010]NDV26803.1 ATP-dependent sacrificial sulfur transferase LarE [Desulfovibrio sp. JC010]